jgi:hypothetical protein
MLPWLLCSLILNRDVGLWQARNGHVVLAAACQLLRDERTSLGRGPRSELDPKATSQRAKWRNPIDGYLPSYERSPGLDGRR